MRVGAWLFRQRTWLPLPLGAAILLLPVNRQLSPAVYWLVGAVLVAAGEGVRLWAVHHIGAISRTRSDRLGPLIGTGPFSLVRNPLYLGNMALWAGFAVSARLVWLAPLVVAWLGFEYHAVVRWEEELLAARLGEPYRAYAARVPRWMPRHVVVEHGPSQPEHSWRETLFSERGTLIAIAVGYLLLYVKNRV